ncbi:hypothetical protein Hanom_Chr04g00290951 [Helianthus anomalus]
MAKPDQLCSRFPVRVICPYAIVEASLWCQTYFLALLSLLVHRSLRVSHSLYLLFSNNRVIHGCIFRLKLFLSRCNCLWIYSQTV